MDKMKIAAQIADAAVCLDWLKSIHAPEDRAEAERHVEALHDIAKLLAGERQPEIYCMED